MKKAVQKQKGAFLRSCIACGQQKSKGELLRVVRTPEGAVFVDETGKADGRGAYVCRCQTCILSVRKSGRLCRSLNTEIPDRIYDTLLQFVSGDAE